MLIGARVRTLGCGRCGAIPPGGWLSLRPGVHDRVPERAEGIRFGRVAAAATRHGSVAGSARSGAPGAWES